jgi:hypothetical protein
MIKAQWNNLQHIGTIMSKYSSDGNRKRKQQVKGILTDTLEQVSMVKNDDPIQKDVVKAVANVRG